MSDAIDLLHRHLNGETLTDSESQTLSDWVCASPDNARFAAELTHLDHSITRDLRHKVSTPLIGFEEADLLDQPAPAETDSEDELPPIHIDATALTKQKYASAMSYVFEHAFTARRVAVLATAAMLLIGMVLAIVLLGGPEAEQQQIVERPAMPSPEPTPVLPPQPEQAPPDDPSLPPQPEVVPPQPEVVPPQPEVIPPQPEVVLPQPVLATIKETIHTQWAGDDLRVGDELMSGTYKLTRGSVLLEMASGAKTLIEAPARFTLTGQNEMTFDVGALDARVPAQATGFTVITPDARIVDIGTEFSVVVDKKAAQTAVSVHVGEVRASATAADADANPPRSLFAGDAVRVGVDAKLEEMEYVSGGFDQAIKVARSRPEITGGAVVYSENTPADLSDGKSTAWSLQLFKEQEGVELSRNVTVNVSPGVKWPIENKNVRRQLKAGIKVNVYLIHVDAEDAFSTKTYTIRFDRPIVGIATSPSTLRATDVLARKGHRRTYDSNMDYRGIEPNDILQLSDDGMTLTVQLRTEKQNLDNARLFVLSQETDE